MLNSQIRQSSGRFSKYAGIIQNLLAVCGFVSLLAVGCGSGQPGELVFEVGGAPNEVEVWEQIVADYEKASGEEVTVLRQPTDSDQRRQSLVLSLRAGREDPDVFLMDAAWIAQFAASDWLQPLDDSIRQSEFDLDSLFDPVVNQLDIHEGQTIALPVYLDCGVLYCRTDLLEEYGFEIPETWGQLAKAALRIQKEKRKTDSQFRGFVWQGAQYEGLVCNFLEFIASNGGQIVGKQGNVTLDSAANRKALQFMHDLIHEKEISPPNTYSEMKEEEVRLFFQDGNAVFERNWPYAWQLHQSEGSTVKGKVKMAVLPKFEGGRHAATLGGWHIGISKFSDSKGAAWKLVEHIMSYESQKRVALELGWNPGRKDIYDDEEVIRKMPQVKVLGEALGYAVSRPNLPYYTQVSEIVQKYVNAALSGRLTVDRALEEAQTEVEKVVEIYHE